MDWFCRTYFIFIYIFKVCFFKLSSKRQNELNPVLRWKRFLDILPFRISSPHLFSVHLLGVNPLSVQGRHLLDRITFYASQFGLKSVECVKKNLIFVFLWKVERESEKWKNRIKAAAQKKDGGTFLPWPPSILETMDSGHQRHCTPPKPLLRLTKYNFEISFKYFENIWPPSILETMDSGHQRHCNPPKPLLRPTKNILKIW